MMFSRFGGGESNGVWCGWIFVLRGNEKML